MPSKPDNQGRRSRLRHIKAKTKMTRTELGYRSSGRQKKKKGNTEYEYNNTRLPKLDASIDEMKERQKRKHHDE